MDSFAIEVSAYRVGGADQTERSFVPRIEQVMPHTVTHVQLNGRIRVSSMLYLQLADWTIVRPGILSCSLSISDEVGRPISIQRPVLYSQFPCDVPLYSSHIGPHAEDGIVTVGLRPPSRAWMPEHTALLAEAG